MQQQVILPALSRVNKILIAVMVASFIFNSVAVGVFKFPLAQVLGLSLSGIKSGLIFQFFTYPLSNVGLMDVLFTGLLFWFLGSELEKLWGERKYIGYLILITLVTGIFYIGVSMAIGGGMVNYPFRGMAAFSGAMCVSYAVLYPDRQFQFFFMIPVKAKYFCMILASMALYQGVFTPGGAQAWGQLCAMALGFYFIKIQRQVWFNKLLLIGTRGGSIGRGKRRGRAKLRIVKSDQKSDSKGDHKEDDQKYWH